MELAQYRSEGDKTYQAFLFANISNEIELFIDTVIAKYKGDIFGTGYQKGMLTPEFIEFFFEEIVLKESI